MELSIHLAIWISAVVYSLYNVFLFTKHVDTPLQLMAEDFQSGWSIVGRMKDASDYEWNIWKTISVDLLPWLIAQFCGAEFLRHNNSDPRIWYILVSFSFIFLKFGGMYFAFLTLQPCLFYMIVRFGCKSKVIWFSSCLMLIVINIVKKYYEQLDDNAFTNYYVSQEDIYMIMISISWIHLRCLSFSLETIYYRDETELITKYSVKFVDNFLNLFSYIFYLPLFFLGPVILYKDFNKALNISHKSTCGRRLFCFIRNAGRYMGWFIFTEFMLHFMYYNALQYYPEMISMMPDWCLYGGGLWMGLYFYLKYLVAYGITGSLAALDHIEPETPPRCVARVHRYSQMWKYFDVGLHKFLIRYIYKPVMKRINKQNVILLSFMRAFSSLICFVFVFLWHGVQGFILIWTVLNYLGIVMESVGITVSQSVLYKRFRMYVLKTESMNDRFNAFLSTPVLIISAVSNFYFFAGFEVGNIYVQRVLNQSFESSLVMFICLYSSCRVSQYFNSLNARKILR